MRYMYGRWTCGARGYFHSHTLVQSGPGDAVSSDTRTLAIDKALIILLVIWMELRREQYIMRMANEYNIQIAQSWNAFYLWLCAASTSALPHIFYS